MASAGEHAALWQVNELGERFDALAATYVTHAFTRHAHEGFAIGVIERGAETFLYRGRRWCADAGKIVVINPGEIHTGEAATRAGWSYRMIYPDASLLRRAASELAGRTCDVPFFPDAVIDDPLLYDALHRLHCALQQDAGKLETQTRLLTTLALLVRQHADARPGVPAPTANAAVQRARDYIHAHYAENVTLEALAGLEHFSPYHFVRVFRRATGMPPHVYLTHVRVARARALLRLGVPPAQVAQDTGFAHQSHLNRAFKRIVGVPPGAYRKNVQDGGGAAR